MTNHPRPPAIPAPKTFFTADTHLDHKNIIQLCGRPYTNVAEMNAALISNWNAVVGQSDRVFLLGDFCFRGSKPAATALEKMNGEIVFLRGNHDSANTAKLPRWAAVHDLLELSVSGRRLVLCHYPMMEWPGVYRGAVHLHGHTHGAVAPTSLRADVGVDCWGYHPVTLSQVDATLAAAPPHDPRAFYSDP